MRVAEPFLGAALSLLAAGSALGRPAPLPTASGGLASLPVPGGTAALARFAGVDRDTPRGVVLLQIIRAVHEAPSGFDAVRDARMERFHAYLVDLAGFIRARSALGGDRISATLARARASRRAVLDVARAIGGDLDERGGAWTFVLRDDEDSRRRQRSLEAAGLDIAALERDFNGGSAATLAIPSDDVPLPFAADAWARLPTPPDAGPGNQVTALLSDRQASLLYYGIMSLDAPTRAFVGAHPSLLGELLKGNRPAILASLGRSIRIRDGVIDAAGGPEAARLWQDLLGRSASQPEPFIVALLDREAGRAALLYDAIDHLDPPGQAFALALRMPDERARLEHLRALLAACAPSLAGWDPEIRPFRRVSFDPVHLLTVTRVLPSGELPAPAGRRFWSAVLSGSDVPDEPDRLLKADGPDTDADAAWLVEQTCVANGGRREQRLRTWLFGQRAFPGLAPAALPQALVVLRGFPRFPMLLLTLERMGVSDAAAYAAAVRHAQRLSEIRDRDAADTALRQFQAALAVLERARFSRALSGDAALRLLGALTRVPLAQDGDYQGGVGVWLDTQFLPALAPVSERHAARAGTRVSAESTLLASMAGVAPGPDSREVAWEGLRYRVDVGTAEFARMIKIRQKQGGHGLDAVLAFCREPARMRASLRSPSDVPARVAALNVLADALPDQPSATPGRRRTVLDVRETVNRAVKELRTIKSSRDVSKAARIAASLQHAGDTLLAGILTSIAYAPHLGEPNGLELLAGDPAERHSFGFEDRLPENRAVNPWRMPQRAVGVPGGWHVTGSILGLDVGLAGLNLRRLEKDGLPPPPAGNDIDGAALAAAVALSSPFAVSDAERDALSDAIRRGRARLRGVTAHPAALPDLVRAARVNEWWREALPWAQTHEPERVPDYFTLADLARIGEAEVAPGPPLDAWGAAWLETEGCLCLRVPRPGMRETLAGRFGTALMAEQFTDVQLFVAEALADLGLPAQLARSVMALAARDVLDTYQPAYIDDWTALATAVHRLAGGRVVDYVSALTSGGPMIPDDGERTDDVRR